jgi:hypothetical protein
LIHISVDELYTVLLQLSNEGSEMAPDLFFSLSSDSCQADDEFECDCGHCNGSGPGHHDDSLDLDWQTIGWRLDSSGRGINSNVQNSSPEIVENDMYVDVKFFFKLTRYNTFRIFTSNTVKYAYRKAVSHTELSILSVLTDSVNV